MTSLPSSPAYARLTQWERIGLFVFASVIVAFGALVVLRSAYQETRKTDFGVYARAAHAIRVGNDIYHIHTCDDNGWHYCYPPPFAILMVPLADPFNWEERTGYLPFGVSVGIWYALSIGLGWFSVHQFAKYALPDAVPGSRRWWYARMVPIYVCIGGIGYTVSRGQVNVLLLALIAGMYAAAIQRRPIATGAWLAGAIALKVIPGFLILFPLVRREWRAAFGLALGSIVLLFILPVSVWGINGAIQNNLTFVDAVLAPGALGTGDQTRAKELTDTTSTDSQSFQAMIHNLRHPDPDNRPNTADSVTRLSHWAIGGVMTIITLIVAWRQPRPTAADQLVFLGCLTAIMLLLSPVSHVHYYTLGLPLVAGLWLKSLDERPGRLVSSRDTLIMLIGWGTITIAILLPYELTSIGREYGAGTVATVALWAFAMRELSRHQSS